MSIIYSNNDTPYRFGNRRLIGRWLKQVAECEGYTMGDVGVVFCSSQQLLQINRDFLAHDYYTDIITFDDSDLEVTRTISGELYIDVDTVRDNAKLFGVTALREMHRVLVHGILHLSGQGDKRDDEAQQMRAKENRYLELLDQLASNE